MEPFQVFHYSFGINYLELMIHLRRNRLLDLLKQILKIAQGQILSKDADTFLKISFFFRCYSHFFAITNQLPGFSISRSGNVEDFFNVSIFSKFKLNINVSISNYSFKYICVVCYLKLCFYNVDFN